MNVLLKINLALVCFFVCSFAAVAEDAEPSFEEQVAASVPLAPKQTTYKKNGADLAITHLVMDKPYLAERFNHAPRSVDVQGDKLTVLFKKEVHRLILPKEVGGKLVYDASFGEAGVKAYDKDDEKSWQPEENFDRQGWFAGRPLGDLIGTQAKEPYHHLVITDAKGKEVIKLGTDEGDGKICWLQNFCRWKDLVFIVDSNCRAIDIWTIQGDFLFEISTRELGLTYPWLTTIDITEDGEMYIGYTQKRDSKEEGQKRTKVTESAFLKITGLDSIKPKAEAAE